MAATVYTGIYADPSDLIAELRLKLVTGEGYTENSISGDLDRLHLQKTMGGRTAYFNMVAIDASPIYGIMGNASTGFDAVYGALLQPGSYETGSAGYLDVVDGGTYTLIADDEYFVCTTVDGSGNRQIMVFTSSETGYGFFFTNTFDGTTARADRFLQYNTNTTSVFGSAVYDGSNWRYVRQLFYGGGLRSLFYRNDEGGLIPALLNNSPNDVIGVPVLIPFVMLYGTDSSNTAMYPFEMPTGIKLVNKKYIEDGEQILIGGVGYNVYQATFTSNEFGIAFKVS